MKFAKFIPSLVKKAFTKNMFQSLLFAFVSCLTVYSQNLVPNPSFEIYTACPQSNASEVYLATPWIEVQSTSDYYNCSSLDANYIARTGTGYMGVAAWRPSWSETYREYIGVQLIQPLTAGITYYGEFWVRLHPDHCWASDGMGMYISQGQPADPPFVQCMYVNAQIMNPQYRMLVGREYWMKICGTYTAIGGEDFITIGSFRDDAASTFLELPGCPNQNYGVHWSYYHIDDVLLEQYDSTANYDCDDSTYSNPNEPNDSSSTCNITIPNVLTPNGDHINENLNTNFDLESYYFKIYDRWGKEVYYTWDGDNRDRFWDGRFEGKILPDGTYFYILFSFEDNCLQKGTITILR
jgi:gliding motility-associated-like protein